MGGTQLSKAFDQANEMTNTQRIEHADYHACSGLISAEAARALHQPLVRYGIKANRKVLETAAQYSFEQGLAPRLMQIDEVMAGSTLEQ